jgi:hypothetical protein
MLRFLVPVLAALLLLPVGAQATERERLGYGRLISNDSIGEFRDRERTGSYVSSRVWGPEWTGRLPDRFGQLIELRLGVELLAPASLRRPRPGSRPWAGALSAGVHTHFERDSVEYSVGAAIYATGPQTHLDDLQRGLHDLIDATSPSDRVLDNQIEDGFHPTVLVETARSFPIGARTTLRPFVEGQAGIETFMRVGFDLTFGDITRGELLVRDSTTGHRYRVVQNTDATGFGFVIGADMARVSDSVFLPSDRGYDLTPRRDRVRAGVHWQGRRASAFYGLTWLGKEYETQPDNQLVGSVRLKLAF